MKKIEVLVVDDSAVCRQLIVGALERDPDIQVVGQAGDGEEAVALALRLKPHVITMDVEMPRVDGLTATERIMAHTPTPILVLTSDPGRTGPDELSQRALAAGALALQVKPDLEGPLEGWDLAREVRLLSTVRVIRHLRGSRRPPAPTVLSPGGVMEAPAASGASVGVVAVAGSTGGPQVLQRLLMDLPRDFPAPLLLVQHINAAFLESLAAWLQATSPLEVRVARAGDLLLPGVALLAPSQAHLVVTARGKVGLQDGPPHDGHLPSATLLFESVARAYGRRGVGVLLTGMGSDGVEGLAAIKAAGGQGVAQSQASSVVFGMPGAAIARGLVDVVVDGEEVASELVRLCRTPRAP